MGKRICWCGDSEYLEFSTEYVRCASCGTLISCFGLTDDQLRVSDDESAFYGKKYWLEHQSHDLGFPDIYQRARRDLCDRNLHWLATLLKYKSPPARTLELGCSHGSFVALLKHVGFDAMGIEMSPWVVEFARKTFNIPMLVGPIEKLELDAGAFDVIALMDVLEHLADPIGTMRHALTLLKPDGLLLIQTPQAKNDMVYSQLIEANAPFLEQLKSDEHLFLFTESSAVALFDRLGAKFIHFERPIFHHYDMFFIVSRQPIAQNKCRDTKEHLETPTGRFVQALLDQDARIKRLEEHIELIDKDREARLGQINSLTKMIHDLQSEAINDKN